jgi:hypothetical protein
MSINRRRAIAQHFDRQESFYKSYVYGGILVCGLVPLVVGIREVCRCFY